MDSIKVLHGIMHGLWDSIAGMKFLWEIDNELNEIEEEKEQAALRRKQMQMHRRSPSPVPSSASSMAREEQEKVTQQRLKQRNPDERTLESMRQSSKSDVQAKKPKRERKIAKKVLKCCLLNGGFTWLSIVLFEYVLLPILKLILGLFYGEKSEDLHSVWSWLQPILSIIFGMMWVMPIFLLSKIVSSLWFADIANAAYKVRKGRPQLIPGFGKIIADFLFSMIVQTLFLLQSMAVNLVSVMYLGQFLSFIHLCMLYSLYSFEYKWFNMGWELPQRLTYIEDNWPYFLGFGVPLTILTSMSSSVIVSGCIFSMFFPLFILSGNEARPIVDTTDTSLRLFTPVVCVSNLFFSKPRRKVIPIKKSAPRQKQRQEPEDQLLTMEERFQLHQMREEHLRQLARRSSSREQQQQRDHSPASSVASTASSTPSYRYRQPPPLQKRLNTQSPVDSQLKSQENFVGMRPLIPTPVRPVQDSKNAQIR